MPEMQQNWMHIIEQQGGYKKSPKTLSDCVKHYFSIHNKKSINNIFLQSTVNKNEVGSFIRSKSTDVVLRMTALPRINDLL